MVSLSRTFDTSTGGGVFFNDMSAETDPNQLQPILGNPDEVREFRPVYTIVIVAFELSVAIGVLVVAIVMASIWPEDKTKCEPYFVVLYLHTIFWVISWVSHHHVKQKHRNLRVNGYFEFYRQTYTVCRAPFYVVSLWNTMMLAVSTAFQNVYPDLEKQCTATGFFKPINYLCLLLAFEVTALFIIITNYVVKVSRFNKARPVPDVLREEWMLNLSLNSHGVAEVGFRMREAHIEDLLEKQADLIRYLQDHNTNLSQKILMLNGRIREQ